MHAYIPGTHRGTYTHVLVHALHTYTCTHLHKRTHNTHSHTWMHTYTTHSYIHTTHARMHIHNTHTQVLTHSHAYIHACTHTYIHNMCTVVVLQTPVGLSINTDCNLAHACGDYVSHRPHGTTSVK